MTTLAADTVRISTIEQAGALASALSLPAGAEPGAVWPERRPGPRENRDQLLD